MNQPAWVQTAESETAEPSLMRERILLRRLREICEWRASTESSLAEWIEQSRASLAEAFAERERAIAEKYDTDREALEWQYRQSIDELEVYYDRVLRETQTESDQVRTEISTRAQANEQWAKKAWKNEIWLIESDFEASEPIPAQQFKQIQKEMAERKEEIESLALQASTLVEQFKQSAILKRDFIDEISQSEAKQILEAGDAPDESGVSVKSIAWGNAGSAIDDSELDRIPAGQSLDDVIESRQAEVRAIIAQGREQLERLSRLGVARLFRGPQMGFLGLLIVAGAVIGTAWLQNWQVTALVGVALGLSVVSVGVVYWLLYRLARSQVLSVYVPLRQKIDGGRASIAGLLDLAARRRLRAEMELTRKREDELTGAKAKFVPMISSIRAERRRASKEHNETYPRRLAELKRDWDEKREKVERRYQDGMAEVEAWRDGAEEESASEHRLATARVNAEFEERWEQLEANWHRGMDWIHHLVEQIGAQDSRYFPGWNKSIWEDWEPIDRFLPVVRFGSINVDQSALPGGVPTDERLQTSYPTVFELPTWLNFPEPCSVFIESDGEGREPSIRCLQNIMLRLLVSIPPGKVRFTIFDPVGLGQNFAGFMHLADHTEALVSERIWTESRHIDQRLLDLTEHMEGVIQKYLRNEYETIAEYNERAGEIAEPYRFLVFADCPANLSEVAARRLTSIVNSGVRCGVYTLVLFDTRQKVPPALQVDDLRRGAVHLRSDANGFHWADADFESYPLSVDGPPGDEFMTEILTKIGEGARDASRVQVPFDRICPTPVEIWSRDSATEFRVELGRSGATKLQSLTLGHGTAQHVLIAGKTGSGKSTLLHVLITNLALWYAPDQVEVYLVDFKKGVEFKTYATHQVPHVRAVAIESDREFGVSVLHRVDAELKRRGDRFRRVGAQDLAGFRQAVPEEAMPRTLLIIDEFQEFFTEDDKLAQDAALLLDRLVRQGRAFGIHIILGSQTLGGAYGLARSTIGQMAVRIALQCSEADSFLIMDEDNSAARLLARPGEAIYNDSSGVVGANSPFQIAWLPEDSREESLRYVEEMAQDGEIREAYPAPIVFEGSVPADIRQNRLLQNLIAGSASSLRVDAPLAWIGEPIAIKDPTSTAFRRQSGGNVLVVGQNDESALSVSASALISLDAFRKRAMETDGEGERDVICVLDGTPPEAPNAEYLKRLGETLARDIEVSGWSGAEDVVRRIGAELESRKQANETNRKRIYFFIHGIQRFRMLRKKDDDFGFSSYADDDEDKPATPDRILTTILRDGPVFGIHTVMWCDSAATLERMLDRTALRQFESRVLFQMGASDSSALIDSIVASQLGLKRAILFCEELGQMEKFRPYALPDISWVSEMAAGSDRDSSE